ncbi:hypothetical protein ZIOFF_050781 [Zingiber officinale]|uniref:Reverse transcriptase Ty1/copia-type domain-containing protein n=1 Tax=Zingiber officinale TaxID=94328 RepID=A0A8J5KGR8_ZINOF|nr:hypothetical protein ZIOFF_050781 [Zingiber officinale]
MAKSMIHEKGLPKTFWAEAFYTVVYLSNRCPTTAIPNKTQFETWSGRKPSVNHLKVFGSICYSQIPKVKRSKLDECSERCIFVSYSTMSKGYKLFSLKGSQVIISRDVQVDENASWNWEENKVETKDFLISTDKEDNDEPISSETSPSDPNSTQLNEESRNSADPTSSNSSSPSSTPKRYRSIDDIYATCNYCSKSKSEATLYVKRQGIDVLIVTLYVDDLIFTGSNKKMIEEFKDDMTQKYEMSDMGLLRHFLGMEIYQEEETVFICQKMYAETILKKFNMLGCNPVSTPLIMGEKLKKEDGGKAADVTHYRSLIGNLLYLTATRPDLMYAASMLSRFMQSPSHFHLGAAKRVLRYVQGTTDLGLSFQKNHTLNLVGYCGSDLGGSLDDMKSTSGYCFSFGSAMISWLSKKQQSVAQSSAEAEYVSASLATSQTIWLQRILADLGHHQDEGTVLYCDNKSAIAMAKNPVHHSRTRHIALKHHFIRQAIEDKEIQLEFCRSEEQLSDILTKALPRERHYERIATITLKSLSLWLLHIKNE